jgi:hypothetical protein
MGLVTVQFECVDQDVPANPVGSAVIRIFDDTDTYVTSMTSDAVTGIASGTLDGAAAPTPNVYYIRPYYFGAEVDTPQRIEVYDPPAGAPTGTNDFKVTFDPHAAEAPADARLCRLSGFVRRIDGTPAAGLSEDYNHQSLRPLRGHVLRFTSMMDPLVVDGNGAFASPVYAEADREGLIEVDLFREGTYSVFVEDIHPNCVQEAHRVIHVPDRSTANLMDILFPTVSDVTWNPAGPWAVAVGGELDVQPTVTASDYRVLTGTATADVVYTVADTSIAALAYKDDYTLTIRGVASGTTELQVTRGDSSIVRIPGDITGGTVVITVT